jgi:uncharacterized protein
MMNVIALTLLGVLVSATPSASPLPTPQSLPTIVIAAPRAKLTLQVAKTEEQQERGLMSVTKLSAHTGMIFVFAKDAQIEFWMKDTLVPLDMVFVGADGKVRKVATNVPVVSVDTPDADIPRRSSQAMYVIELPADEAAPDGIVPGVKLALHAGTP